MPLYNIQQTLNCCKINQSDVREKTKITYNAVSSTYHKTKNKRKGATTNFFPISKYSL